MSSEFYATLILPLAGAIAGWVIRVERKLNKIDEVHADMQEVKESTSAIMWHLVGKKTESDRPRPSTK
jgi:hypothetical protein